MNIDSGIKDRITTAANALYEEAARSAFPTVAEVRARAGSDMNAASLVMRDWRRAQTVQAAPVVVEVPGKVQKFVMRERMIDELELVAAKTA